MIQLAMRVMVTERPREPLVLKEVRQPEPGAGQVLVRVAACAVCRTDLHVLDGELPEPKLPLILGHEIVGRVVSLGAEVTGLEAGQRVGIPWLAWTCGDCGFCRGGQENLCERAWFTGYTCDGGYAVFTVADAQFCFPLAEGMDDVSAVPLLCAGLIGYRSLRKTGQARVLGIYGFGAAAHIVTQVARHQGRQVLAFTRPGDTAAQESARGLGAVWTGGSDQAPPKPLDAAIIFAPAGALVPITLRAVPKGGTVDCGGIHMSETPAFSYRDLWHERTLCSVANLTHRDGEEFLQLAPTIPIRTETQAFRLEEANEALTRLREGRLQGAAVLVPWFAVNPGHGHHEFGNAETELWVGAALGRAMVELLERRRSPVPAEAAKPGGHVARTVEGWTVRVDDRLLAPPHDETGRRALRFLEGRLFDIQAVVPAGPLERLQRVVLVLDLSHGDLTAIQYHPSADWLAEHGYDTNLARCVHIPVAADLPTPRNIREQPWVVLHELAHAYHDQVLGFDDLPIREAYEAFRRSGHGDQALLHDGTRARHYGLTDPKEFFAEMTEAFFGSNDFQPFNRAELRTAEPAISDLLESVWREETAATTQ